jgi:phospholipid/cholesterol/gamma-HCH transport system permease protein
LTTQHTSLYFHAVRNARISGLEETETSLFWRSPLPQAYINFIGRRIVRFFQAIHGLGAFALITFGVLVTKLGRAREVVHPLILAHASRSGWRLLPMILFLALALGLVVIGQTVSLLNRVGAQQFLGTVMVTVVVRELGPLLTALIVLSRTGTANVIELGTARALGEVEALEALGIDPVHYLVVPRVVGMALGIFSLTMYLILGALVSGYGWAFIQDVPLLPADYFRQLATALRGLDFVLLALKTMLFGAIIAIVTCYYGLAQPLRLEQVSNATVRAVAQSVVGCVLLDALFIIIYLVS